MKTGFVFDLDGTLVDSIPGIARGLNLALKALGYPEHSVDAIRGMVGRGARELCLASLREYFHGEVPEEAFEAVHKGFMKEYPHTWQDGTAPYPGIREMLLELAAEGHPLGVLSNKPHVVTGPLVRHILPEVPFQVVMGFSDRFPRKPEPGSLLSIVHAWGMEPGQVCMVGDSAHDGNTAVNAGTRLVLVGWGYSSRAALDAFHVPVCASAAELSARLWEEDSLLFPIR
ncbi:HAD family hydrolase [Akkermansia sp.]|uniref:HAD family hydrolase n=1 Tax=Akkermansia sp. TaxID=1872421 RepID=UPI0025BD8BE1|nr:HAD family hydrolase [Akkermansia sp.]